MEVSCCGGFVGEGFCEEGRSSEVGYLEGSCKHHSEKALSRHARSETEMASTVNQGGNWMGRSMKLEADTAELHHARSLLDDPSLPDVLLRLGIF